MASAIGVDIGGTFTDTVVMDSQGGVSTYKSPTTPDDLIGGLLANIVLAAGNEGRDVGKFLGDVARVGHGTTAATNAFIERRGARVGLVTTRGFEDTIFQQRMLGMTAGLTRDEVTDYSRRAVPEPLCPPWRVMAVRERLDWRGDVVMPLVEDDVRAAARKLAAEQVEAVAVCFLWSFKNPAHERRAAELLAESLPGVYLSVSSDVAPRLGEYERMATTLVNAYLGPGIARYADTLESRLAEQGYRARVLLLDSAGGMMTPGEARRQPVRLLVSGPSGGLTASERLGEALGHRNVITFDMGGTSADVGLIVDGVPLRRHETEVGKYHLLLSMADITAIGAGGGSIARVEGGGYLRVGPESAGADPGPACYGRGGEYPTVTDADLVLGILDPDRFLGGRLTLDRAAAERALETHVAGPLGMSVAEAAAGVKRIVDNRMADLLRTVTLERGHDPRAFVLYAFGGAGPMHAASFALDLVDTIVVPATQSVHSALGAIASNVHVVCERSEPMRVQRGELPDAGRVLEILDELERQADAALAEQGVGPEDRLFDRWVEMRYARQTKELRVPLDSPDALYDDFEQLYARRYGPESVPSGVGYELVTFSVEARGRLARPGYRVTPPEGPDPTRAQRGRRDAFDPVEQRFVPHDILDGEALRPQNRIDGPAIVEFPGTTVAVATGQTAVVDELENIAIGWSA
ncbi:MAG: hydantoinase/oxoprolinase family protein [Gaiellaceae bacterium]